MNLKLIETSPAVTKERGIYRRIASERTDVPYFYLEE
jgi:hypothetical protein